MCIRDSREGGAFTLFRFDIDRAAHKADHALYDSHAKTRAFDLGGARIVRTRERLEQALHELFAHAAPGVAEHELVARAGLDRARKLGDAPVAYTHLDVYKRQDPFYAEGGKRSTLRLNFTNADEETIRSGIKHLAEVIEAELA